MAKSGKENLNLAQVLQRIGANVRRIRLEKGYSQEDMLGFGFNLRYYQQIEYGRANPTVEFLHRIAEAFGVSVSDLTESC